MHEEILAQEKAALDAKDEVWRCSAALDAAKKIADKLPGRPGSTEVHLARHIKALVDENAALERRVVILINQLEAANLEIKGGK